MKAKLNYDWEYKVEYFGRRNTFFQDLKPVKGYLD